MLLRVSCGPAANCSDTQLCGLRRRNRGGGPNFHRDQDASVACLAQSAARRSPSYQVITEISAAIDSVRPASAPVGFGRGLYPVVDIDGCRVTEEDSTVNCLPAFHSAYKCSREPRRLSSAFVWPRRSNAHVHSGTRKRTDRRRWRRGKMWKR